MLIHEYVGASAAARSDATAVRMGDEQLTYAQIEDLSDRLATALVESGCAPGDRVALLTPKCPIAVVAMHATLKAGCAYVPVDTDSPPARMAHIFAAAEPRVVLGLPETGDSLAALSALLELPTAISLASEPLVVGETTTLSRTDWESLAPLAQRPALGPDSPAHLLFTSGSTGVPKGVVITHANVDTFVSWAVSAFGTAPTDRISGHPPLHFDLSTFDIYGTLKAGAELHMVPSSLNLNPRGMAALIRDAELTQWFSVPSALAFMSKFDVVAQDDFPALERLLWCGEVLATPVLRYWMQRLPHVRFTNLYGPTEATIASSFYTVPSIPDDDSETIPIGEPCDGEELLVLDEALAPTPPGTIGDLYIAGVGLSPGYWRDSEKTAAAFLPDPRDRESGARIYRTGDLAQIDGDGLFHFLGRADSQIKSRGYRIELGEIETALGAVDGVGECAVVGVDLGGFEGTSICAAYVADGDDAMPQAEVRRALLDHLPSYMIPFRWLTLPSLPKNQNGKIDRPALRNAFTEMEDAA